MSRSACQSPVTVSRTKTMAHRPLAGGGRTTHFPGRGCVALRRTELVMFALMSMNPEVWPPALRGCDGPDSSKCAAPGHGRGPLYVHVHLYRGQPGQPM